MEQTREYRAGVIRQARPAAQVKAAAGARLAYIDTLRMVLTILVIMVHAAVTYGSLGSWTYEDPVQDELAVILLSLFVIACQSFFMGLFFFYAGYFTPASYDRKGLDRFWKDRLLRLGIPMVAYTWFLSKIPNYISAVANYGMELSFGEFFTRYFWSWADEGPTWFLFALLAFSLGYTLWRLATRSAGLSAWLRRQPFPSTPALVGLGLVMGAFTFAVSQVLPLGEMADVFGLFSLQFQFFPTYVILFAGGALAYRSGWLDQLPVQTLRFWGWLSAALLTVLPALMLLGGAADGKLELFLSGFDWRCAAMSLWLGLACVSFSMTLTLWLRSRVAPDSRLSAFAGRSNYAAYLIHPLVLVPITWALSFLAIPSLVKFAAASALTVPLCYLIAVPLRRIPGMKAVL